MRMTRLEMETQVNFNAAEDNAEVYTTDPVMFRKMQKLIEKRPDLIMITKEHRAEGEVVARSYSVPKKLVSVRVPRMLSEETKKNIAEQLRSKKRP